MMTNRTITTALLFALFSAALAGCTSSGGNVTSRSSSQPRLSTWKCTGGFSMTVRNTGATMMVTDTRGVEVDLPPDPPGQRERYGKTGYALVFEGRNASWFVSGKVPSDCKR